MDRQFPGVIRRNQPIHRAREEWLTDRALQRLDPVTHGRLGQAEAARRRRQASRIENREEGPLSVPVRRKNAHRFSMSSMPIFVNFLRDRLRSLFRWKRREIAA
jgi:hypothetical protein